MEYEDPIFLIVTLIYKKRQRRRDIQPLSGFETSMQEHAADPKSEATHRVCIHLEGDLLTKSLSKYSGVFTISQSSRVKAPAEGGGDAWYREKRNKEIDLFSLPLLVLGVL